MHVSEDIYLMSSHIANMEDIDQLVLQNKQATRFSSPYSHSASMPSSISPSSSSISTPSVSNSTTGSSNYSNRATVEVIYDTFTDLHKPASFLGSSCGITED